MCKSMEQNVSSVAANCSAVVIFSTFCTARKAFHIQKSQPLVPIQSQLNSVYILPFCFLNIIFNIIIININIIPTSHISATCPLHLLSDWINLNLLKPNDIYIYIYIYMSYRSANLQTLHFKYLFNKYTY